MSDPLAIARRWRLVLGHYAAQPLAGAAFSQQDWRLDQALDYLYGREYERRGLQREGALDSAGLRALDWLQRSAELFPQEVCERLQAQALERYGLTELLSDPATLERLDPSPALGKALLGLRGRLGDSLRDAVRRVIRKVVEELTRRLRPQFEAAFSGRRHRFRRSGLASSQNFDWRATIAANLRHYDRSRRQLLIERPCFNARVRRRLPWQVILCVDQSGSMLDSVMHSAVAAGILCSLPEVEVRLVLFDTRIVDLSHLAADPVEVLLTVQLGGGTDIGRALRYCEQLVRQPARSVLVLLSDFCEGGPPGAMLAAVRRLHEARVRLLGLAALDDQQQPVYDRRMGQRLANLGMQVAALTPGHFAQWLAEVMQ